MKLSQWHKGSIKPVHEGVYEVIINNELYYSRWNGNNWNSGWLDINECNNRPEYLTMFPDIEVIAKWRGIVKEKK